MLREELAIKDLAEMGKRTYEMAVNFAYKGIKENEYPSDEYKQTRYEKCKYQIALAGYRLADWLREALGTPNETPVYAEEKTTK